MEPTNYKTITHYHKLNIILSNILCIISRISEHASYHCSFITQGDCMPQVFKFHFSPAVQPTLLHISVSQCWPPTSKQASQCLKIFLDTQRNYRLDIKNILFPSHARKIIWEEESIALLILTLSIRWKWVVNFMPKPIYAWQKNSLQYPLNSRLGRL